MQRIHPFNVGDTVRLKAGVRVDGVAILKMFGTVRNLSFRNNCGNQVSWVLVEFNKGLVTVSVRLESSCLERVTHAKNKSGKIKAA